MDVFRSNHIVGVTRVRKGGSKCDRVQAVVRI